ncbi:MAG: glycosyltransferase family 4 protein [Armatimonadetes bacterium]|nr:glycosyltransferase family 4 protein [Armatimonadota bacterium]
MRIVYVITRADDIGGAQIHVRDLSYSLLRRGHEVAVIGGGYGAFSDELDRLGVPFHSSKSLVRPLHLRHDLRALMQIRRLLSKLRPDIVSTHSSKAGLLGRLAAKSLRIPVIFTAHGWAFTDGVAPRSARLYCLLERLAARSCGRIITVSEYDRALGLRRHIAPPGKLAMVHNGVLDLSRDFMCDPTAHPPRLVMVAGFRKQKDHQTLIRALSELRRCPWTLELIGDEPDCNIENSRQAALREMITSHGLEGRVSLLGRRLDIAERLAGSQIFILISNWEGLPRSILEAMRAGMPVVATDVGGVNESVNDGITGFLVPRGDTAVLRDRLSRLISDPLLRARMGALGRARFETHFTFEDMLRRTLNVYEDVLGSDDGLGTFRGQEQDASKKLADELPMRASIWSLG